VEYLGWVEKLFHGQLKLCDGLLEIKLGGVNKFVNRGRLRCVFVVAVESVNSNS
jgi:hypothetical protein